MKHHKFYTTVLGIILTTSIMLLPSLILGVPERAVTESRYSLFLVFIALWVCLESIGASQTAINKTKGQAQWLPYAISFAMLAVFLSCVTERLLSDAMPLTIVAGMGVISMIIGIILRFLAIRTLKHYFLDHVVLLHGHQLVTTGIYSRLRHPSESGNLCIVMGCSLLFGSVLGLIISLLIVLPITLIRTRLEDQLLQTHFATQFTTYRLAVSALFPLKTICTTVKNGV